MEDSETHNNANHHRNILALLQRSKRKRRREEKKGKRKEKKKKNKREKGLEQDIGMWKIKILVKKISATKAILWYHCTVTELCPESNRSWFHQPPQSYRIMKLLLTQSLRNLRANADQPATACTSWCQDVSVFTYSGVIFFSEPL